MEEARVEGGKEGDSQFDSPSWCGKMVGCKSITLGVLSIATHSQYAGVELTYFFCLVSDSMPSAVDLSHQLNLLGQVFTDMSSQTLIV